MGYGLAAARKITTTFLRLACMLRKARREAAHMIVTALQGQDRIEQRCQNMALAVRQFALQDSRGSHALGHTRMATESRVTTEGSHPFSTGLDLCLVHNGSLSNHNRLRANLRREGIEFQTENDTEVAAGYLAWRMREGASLEQALEGCLDDLDGFYTFLVGTADGFAVLRDPIACKPAVMAETDDWVAMASEYRAIAVLPGAASIIRGHEARVARGLKSGFARMLPHALDRSRLVVRPPGDRAEGAGGWGAVRRVGRRLAPPAASRAR